MSASGSANLRNIGLNNAARFPNDVLVIDLDATALGGFQGFEILALAPNGILPGTVTVYVQPDLNTPDQLAFGVNGTGATGAGDDSITFSGPSPLGLRPITAPVVTGGPGNDSFVTSTEEFQGVAVTAYGGSGDDTITGGLDNDTLHGDSWDDGSISPAGILTLDVPAAAPGDDQIFGGDGDDTISGDGGDDRLFGQQGPDTLDGGAGSDFLDGGPRGEGYLDQLTGGPGADAFILNYTQGSSTGTSFWSQYVSTDLGTTALDEVKVILEVASKEALEEALGKLVGGLVLTGIGDGLGVLLETFIEDLLNTPKPKSKEDVLVVTDFDPSEDALFLPIETGLTLNATPTYFANSASGQEGWGIAYTDGTSGDLFAEVFLDTTSYLPALGITNDQPDPDTETEVKQIIDSVLSTSVQITPGGIVNLSSITALSAEGVLSAATKSGTTLQVFGAFGPMTVVNPDDGSPLVAAGSVYGDYLTVNSQAVLPEDWQPDALYAATGRSLIRGFAGDDLLYGGAGPDVIYGDAGDDDLYGFFPIQQSALLEADQLYGGDGDDLIVTGMSLADVDGGTGTDTLSFRYSTLPVTVDLPAGRAFDGIGTAEKPNYKIAHIENVTGTAQDDTITGDASDNVIDGQGGNDHLDGGGGNDTLVLTAYASTSSYDSAVIVDLVHQTVTGVGTTGMTIANFESVVGVPTANNTFYATANAAAESNLTGAASASVVVGGQTVALSDVFVPNAAADHLTSHAAGITVDYSGSPAGVVADLGSTGPQSGGWAAGDVYAFTTPAVANLIGSAFADSLTGSGGAILTGGAGADVFGVGTGVNKVVDFNPAEGDRIDVSAYGYTSLDELQPNMRFLGNDPITVTILGDSAPDSFTFVDPSNNIFTASSFIYAPAAPGLFTASSHADAHASIELVGKYAAYDNALGIFEIMGDDTIGEVEILIPSSKAADVGSRIALDTIELGDRYGFFLVQDHPLTDLDGSFALHNTQTGSGLDLADLLDPGTEIGLVRTDASGTASAIDAKVFLSTDLGDGQEQARTTANDDGSTLVVFEDQDRSVASDNDFNDLEILITTSPTEQA